MADADLNAEQELLIAGVSRTNSLLHVGNILEEILQNKGTITSICWVEPNKGMETQGSIIVKLNLECAQKLREKVVIQTEHDEWKITANRPAKLNPWSVDEEPMAVDEDEPQLHGFDYVPDNVDRDILECIKKSEYMFFIMQKVFQNTATVQVRPNSVSSSGMPFTFKPTIQKEGIEQTQVEFERSCMRLLGEFIGLIAIETCSFPTEQLVELQQRYKFSEIIPRKVEGEQDHQFLVKWIDELSPGTIKVVGMSDDVAAFTRFIKEKMVATAKQPVSVDHAPEEHVTEASSERRKRVNAPENGAINRSASDLTTDTRERTVPVAHSRIEREDGSVTETERDTPSTSSLDLTPSQSADRTTTSQQNYDSTSELSASRSSSVSSKELINYKKIDNKNFTRTFSWFQLLQENPGLFTGNDDKCVLICNLPSTCSYKDLRNYFKQSTGPVSRIIRIQDGVLVMFQDKAFVKEVLRTEHTYDQEQLTVVAKKIPKIDNKRLLIEGKFEDEEEVQAILDVCKIDADCVIKIKSIQKSMRYLIRFSKSTDVLGLIKQIKELPLSESKPKMARVCCTDCIKLTGVEGLSDDRVKLVCVKKKIPITCVQRASKPDVAYLYLRDYRDAESLINTTIEVRGKKLKIKNYIQEIDVVQEIEENFDFPEETAESSTSELETSPPPLEKQKKKNRKVESFERELESDPRVLELVYRSDELMADLSEHLVGVAKVELVKSKGFLAEFTPTAKQKRNYEGDQDWFERDCVKATQRFLTKFVSEKHKFSPQDHQTVTRKYRKKNEDKSFIHDSDMHLLIDWSSKGSSVQLTGSKQSVDNLKQMFKERMKTVTCSQQEHQILDGCGILDAAQREFMIATSKCNNSYNLLLHGTSANVSSAERFMENERKDIATSDLPFLNEAKRQFLQEAWHSKSTAESRIQNQLKEHNLKVVFQLKEDGPVLYHKKRDLARSKEVVDKAIQCKTVDFDDDIEEIESDRDWKYVLDFVRKTGVVSLSRKNQKLTVVGLSPDFEEALKRIGSYFSQIAEKEDVVKMDALPQSFICNFSSALVGSQVLNPVDWHVSKQGVWLVGKKRNVQIASDWLREIVKSLKSTSKIIEESWKVKYLLSEPGKQFLKTLETESQCCIKLEKDEVDPRMSDSSHFAPKTQWNHERPSTSRNNQQRYPTIKIPQTDVTIKLVKGDITLHRTDAIVNTSNNELELRSAGVSGSIGLHGGPKIQMEMDLRRHEMNGRLRTGEAVTTSAGKLPCKKIIHVAGPVWYQDGFQKSSVCLKTSVLACLREAEINHLSSIAIPAISCGVFGGKAPISAKLIVEAIVEHFQGRRTSSSVTTVDLIELSNREIMDEFSKQLNKLSSSFASLNMSDPTPKERSTASTFAWNKPRDHKASRSFEVIVEKGNILNVRVDCIVNTAGPRFNLSLSQLSRNLLKEAGSKLQSECDDYPIHTGKAFRVTSGGSMPFTYIIHLMIADRPNDITSDLVKVLKFADDKMRIKSIAIPAIGTGNSNIRTDEAVNAMKWAIGDFKRTNPKNLKTIRVVIFDEELVWIYERALSSFLTPRELSQPSSSRGDYEPPFKNEGPSKGAEFPPLVEEPVKEHAPLKHNRRKYDAIMLLLCSTKESNFDKAYRQMRFHFEKRFAETTLKDLPAQFLTDVYVDTFKETHTVLIKVERDKSHATVLISGLQDDVSAATKELKGYAGSTSAGGSSKSADDEWVR